MDDWEKKYYQNKIRQAHQGVSNQIPQYNDSNLYQNPSKFGQGGDVDVTNALLQRLSARQGDIPQHLMGTNMNTHQAQQQASNSSMREVALRPGSRTYTQVQMGNFGTTTPVVKEHSTVPPNMNPNQVVIFRKKITGYLVENHTQAIDLSRLTERLDLIQEFCVVEIPLVGTFLVKEEAIVEKQIAPQGRHILRG